VQHISNKLMFLAATGAMWAVVAYGAQLESVWFGPDDAQEKPQAFASTLPLTPALFAAPAQERPELQPPSAPAKGGASVLPNSASCPAAGTLLSPPSVDKLIGNEGAAVTRGAPGQAQSNANLGTGTSCPPLRADAEKPRTPALSAPASGPLTNAENKSRAAQP
jgi:hypothetical protein